jgi:hypothetical protein
MMAATPKPLFDTLENLTEISQDTWDYIDSLNISGANQEFKLGLEFLKSYANSKDTFTSYRREVERLIQWTWLIHKKSLKEIDRNNLRDYLHFVANPPTHWISTKNVARFIIDEMKLRRPNPEWRPFVVRISKNARRHGKTPSKSEYQLSSKSMEAIFAGLSSFFYFLTTRKLS